MKKPGMKLLFFLLNLLFGVGVLLPAQEWRSFQLDSLVILYKQEETALTQVAGLITESKSRTESYFGRPFRDKFLVRIHCNRSSFERQLAQDWHEPGFRSECWMVASGSAPGIDLLSPDTWDTAACEHRSVDTASTRKVICHELVHVYHGQLNRSPDFSNTTGLDWFVEGLATLVSGQLDTTRRSQVLERIRLGQVPGSLDEFWTGKARYGFSAAMVEYIDNRYGRKIIQELLPLTTKAEVLDKLKIEEDYLIKDFIISWPRISGARID
jgi:hypothetical protein